MDNYKNILSDLYDSGIYTEFDSAYADNNCITAFGEIGKNKVYSFILLQSGYTSAACKKIIRIYELAAKTGSPIVGFYSSNGVSLKESYSVFEQYGILLNKCFSVSGVVPQISVIYGSCLGISALMCNSADIVIGVKDCGFYAAPNGEGTTDSAFENGTVDVLTDDINEAVTKAKDALSYFPLNNLSPLPEYEFEPPVTANDFISSVADEGTVFELKKNYANTVHTALANIGGKPAGFVVFNGDKLYSDALLKAEQFIKVCNAYNLPIITVSDSTGLNESDDAVRNAAKLASAYSDSTCPKISIITRKAVGSTVILLSGKGTNADITYAWKDAVISPLPVESAVSFMYSERLASGEKREILEKEYLINEASAEIAAKNGAVDEVILPEDTRNKIIYAIELLSSKRESTIPRKHTVK